jgi:hypothetical protein
MGAVRRECRDAVQHRERISQELRSPAHLAAPSPTISKGGHARNLKGGKLNRAREREVAIGKNCKGQLQAFDASL